MRDEWEILQQFIREARGPSPFGLDDELTRDMDLYHDLDWRPDRIVEIMNWWAERFGVDISEFDIAHYIPSVKMRTSEFLVTTLKAPFSATARDALGGRLLTLGMMEEAMRRGRWVRE